MAALPLAMATWHATAATTTGGSLSLAPAQGVRGSDFRLTFRFSVAVCEEYSVGDWWGKIGHQENLGGAAATGTGQDCSVSIEATVPSDAAAAQAYPVNAYSAPHGTSVDAGPGPSGHASFLVLPPSSAGSTTTSLRSTAESTTASASTSSVTQSSAASALQADAVSSTSSSGGDQTAGTSGDQATQASPGPDETRPAVVSGSPGAGAAVPLIWAALVVAGAGAAVFARRAGPFRRRRRG